MHGVRFQILCYFYHHQKCGAQFSFPVLFCRFIPLGLMLTLPSYDPQRYKWKSLGLLVCTQNFLSGFSPWPDIIWLKHNIRQLIPSIKGINYFLYHFHFLLYFSFRIFSLVWYYSTKTLHLSIKGIIFSYVLNFSCLTFSWLFFCFKLFFLLFWKFLY